MGGPLWVSFSPSASEGDEYPLWLVKFIRRSEEEEQLCVFDLYSGICWPSFAVPCWFSPPQSANMHPPSCRYMLIRQCLFQLAIPRLNSTSAIHRKSPLSRHRSYRLPA